MTDTAVDSSPTTPTAVDFWFDPTCPWAWMTSRWVGEVEQHRDLDVTWHVMSLFVLNEGQDIPENYKEALDRNQVYSRLVTAARLRHGQDVVKRLYDALGEHIHHRQEKDPQQVVPTVLEELGLEADLADAAWTDETDAAMRESHRDGIERVGQDVGTPVIAVEGTAFFGPVISPAPKGQQALDLWDGVVAAARYPGFFELKRSRTVGPIFDTV
ncbi:MULTISPECIES: DsbA family protein [unclassified Curtobacterium]|uniref:mycothiol-dependent nitroreductase Rv2466c family protein n=1 Tax=unclassified Curtobacterium TaxID=257496 RepID=UPI000DA72952|nr:MULTISPECIES: DsbA family protein [unclassified Curtobacterium]PZE25609.1 disulfide bond formation protein DsbA [Curtobacterium sp. MCBD17_028]PZE78522.1 disulfide bond formation protein DsbA [Curtobacterium sp. MCBD17_019]PZF57094.1 disulfide bond formation protein DsbA [Curtobacterium sp. MCBD17_034]PZM33557.1 disulfide bond formation protein DsbA [Curtobacterium sp. MCBD17_031]WIB64341.1 DsbA family protein [Curtobacterium sp. MCBD17_040]